MSQIEPKSTQDFRQAQKLIADFKEQHNRQLQGLIALENVLNKQHSDNQKLGNDYEHAEQGRLNQLDEVERLKKDVAKSKIETAREILKMLNDSTVVQMLSMFVRDHPEWVLDDKTTYTLSALQKEFNRWITEIARECGIAGKVEPIVLSTDAKITLHRNKSESWAHAYNFAPLTPFSDARPEVTFKVLSTGWRIGDLVLEAARLEPLPEQLNWTEAQSTSTEPQAQSVEAEVVAVPIQVQHPDASSTLLSQYARSNRLIQVDRAEDIMNKLKSSTLWGTLGNHRKTMYAILMLIFSAQEDVDLDTVVGKANHKYRNGEPTTLNNVIERIHIWQTPLSGQQQAIVDRLWNLYEANPLQAELKQGWDDLAERYPRSTTHETQEENG